MDVNRSEVAQYLMQVRSKSSVYSKQEFAQILTKLYYFLVDVDDLSPIRYKRFESRSNSGKQLGNITKLLSETNGPLGATVEQKLLISLIEVTLGSLEELTSRKIEYALDIFIKYYYNGAVKEMGRGQLESDFILDRLEKCFDLKTMKRTV